MGDGVDFFFLLVCSHFSLGPDRESLQQAAADAPNSFLTPGLKGLGGRTALQLHSSLLVLVVHIGQDPGVGGLAETLPLSGDLVARLRRELLPPVFPR